MAAEYLNNAVQTIPLNGSAIMDASIPCNRGYIFHEDGTSNFILRGITNGCNCNRYARYQLVFNGNIAIPEGGTATPIAMAISVNGETRQTSIATVTPAAVQEYNNITSTAIITVPRGCCFNVSVRAVTPELDTAATPAPNIELRNANLTINRIS